MCGICGFISKRIVDSRQLEIMNDSMLHRGPDDAGALILKIPNQYFLGMAQRRLSIIDLSNNGHQPMYSSDRNIIIVFNGEIYNFGELKKKIPEYPFKSNTDTEVIIAAYQKWGIECVNYLNGMYAFCIYDKLKKQLFMVRDRMGQKPLYYWIDGNNIVFSSELKPIMLYPYFKKEINIEVIPRFLYQQYINAPNTIFRNVYQLEPGCMGIFYEGNLTIKRYWSIADEYKKGLDNLIEEFDDAKERLKNVLYESVKKRMIADVPFGTFLSGGYDSSLVTAIAQELSDHPVKTFSIGFYDKKYNEAQFAKSIADFLGTEHTELYITTSDMLKLVDSIPQYYDEPFADSSQIPTMLVSMLAKNSVTVALSGDGGDEFFCGYENYALARIAQMTDNMGMLLNYIGRIGFGKKRIEQLYPTNIYTIAQNRDYRFKTQFGGETYVEIVNRMMGNSSLHFNTVKYDLENLYNVKSWQIKRMLLDMDTYLPGDILTKLDRASMKYSLETRCPMLDVNFIKCSFRIPHKYKFYRNEKKFILKELAYDYIPEKLLNRPKQGFSVPIDTWLRGELKERLEFYSDEHFLKKQDIFDAKYVSQLINNYLDSGDKGKSSRKNYSKICWPFFVFQQWYLLHCT